MKFEALYLSSQAIANFGFDQIPGDASIVKTQWTTKVLSNFLKLPNRCATLRVNSNNNNNNNNNNNSKKKLRSQFGFLQK